MNKLLTKAIDNNKFSEDKENNETNFEDKSKSESNYGVYFI